MVSVKKLREDGYVIGLKDTFTKILDNLEAYVGQDIEETRIYHTSNLEELMGSPPDHYLIVCKLKQSPGKGLARK